jgi:hypothetical protein
VRKRPLVFATLAVILVGVAGATTVFLVGSTQRRDDRAAYLVYERVVLVPLVDGGRVVQLEMKPSLDQLRAGSISTPEALRRADAWKRALAKVRSDVVALAPPAFLRDMERRWLAAIDLYAQIPDLFVQAARASSDNRAPLLDAAENAGKRADDLFDRASERMQFHRRRLGLGPTSKLPDPAATRAS